MCIRDSIISRPESKFVKLLIVLLLYADLMEALFSKLSSIKKLTIKFITSFNALSSFYISFYIQLLEEALLVWVPSKTNCSQVSLSPNTIHFWFLLLYCYIQGIIFTYLYRFLKSFKKSSGNPVVHNNIEFIYRRSEAVSLKN